MKKTIALSLLLMLFGFKIGAQTLTTEDIVGTWKVLKVNVLEEMSEENKQTMEMLETSFLKSKFEFKEDKNFSFDFDFEEMKIVDAHWEYDRQTERFDVQDWTDKDTSKGSLMGIKAARENDKVLFHLLETSLVLEVEKVDAEQPVSSGEWQTVDNEKFRFSYPNSWNIDTSGLMGTSFFLFSQVSDASDQFRENINLLLQDLSAYNLNLDQYVEVSEKQIETMVTEGNIILSERRKDENREFQKVIYTGKQGLFDLKFEQYYWIENNVAYILTFTCELNEFDKYQVVGEQIMNSFELK